MTTYRRGRLWWADVAVNGQRVRRSLDTTSMRVARVRERELMAQVEAGQIRGEAPRLRDIADEYLRWSAVQHPTWAKTEGYILGIALPKLQTDGAERMDELTAGHVERLKIWLRTADPTAKPPKKAASQATVNRYMQTLRALYNRAAEWGRYDGPSPLAHVRMFRESRDLRPISAEDMDKILATARAISAKPESPFQRIFADLVILCSNTGLRRSEALQLRWRNVDTDSIMVRGKGGKTRIVPLNAEAAAAISRQPRLGEYVLDVPNRAQSKAVTRTYARVSKALGRPFRLHDLRHRFATSLLERGADIKTVGELLGHSTSMVAILYAHSSPEKKRRAVDLLNATSRSAAQDGR